MSENDKKENGKQNGKQNKPRGSESELKDLLSCVFLGAGELQEKLYKANKICGNGTIEENMRYKTIARAYEKLDEMRDLMRSA